MEATLHHLPDYHTWRSPSETQKNTIIDHVFHTPLPSNMHLHEVGTVHCEVTNTLSDHLPIWISLSLTDAFILPQRWSPQPTDLDMDNEDELKKYNEHLTARIKTEFSSKFRRHRADGSARVSGHASMSGLAVLLSHTVSSVHAKERGLNKAVKTKISLKCQSLRSNFKNGSPQMRQLQIYMYFYQNLLRMAFPAEQRPSQDPWTAHSYQRLLHTWLKKWKKRHSVMLGKISIYTPAGMVSYHPPIT
jgi:hypothetical protein